MSTATKPQTEKLTFEQANEELRRIVTRLDETGVPVHEISELTARGKALVAVQRAYLTEQQARIDEIEAGENLPPFEIVAPASAQPAAVAPAAPAAAPQVPEVDVEDVPSEETAEPAEPLSELPGSLGAPDADAAAEARLSAARGSARPAADDDIPF